MLPVQRAEDQKDDLRMAVQALTQERLRFSNPNQALRNFPSSVVARRRCSNSVFFD